MENEGDPKPFDIRTRSRTVPLVRIAPVQRNVAAAPSAPPPNTFSAIENVPLSERDPIVAFNPTPRRVPVGLSAPIPRSTPATNPVTLQPSGSSAWSAPMPNNVPVAPRPSVIRYTTAPQGPPVIPVYMLPHSLPESSSRTHPWSAAVIQTPLVPGQSTIFEILSEPRGDQVSNDDFVSLPVTTQNASVIRCRLPPDTTPLIRVVPQPQRSNLVTWTVPVVCGVTLPTTPTIPTNCAIFRRGRIFHTHIFPQSVITWIFMQQRSVPVPIPNRFPNNSRPNDTFYWIRHNNSQWRNAPTIRIGRAALRRIGRQPRIIISHLILLQLQLGPGGRLILNRHEMLIRSSPY